MLSRKQISTSHFRFSRTAMYSLMSTLSALFSPTFWLIIGNSCLASWPPWLKIDQLLRHDDPVPVLDLDVLFKLSALHNPVHIDVGEVFFPGFVVADELHLAPIGKRREIARGDDRL